MLCFSIPYFLYTDASLLKSGLFQKKNPNRKVDDMEFLGVLKKKHVEIPGVN